MTTNDHLLSGKSSCRCDRPTSIHVLSLLIIGCVKAYRLPIANYYTVANRLINKREEAMSLLRAVGRAICRYCKVIL